MNKLIDFIKLLILCGITGFIVYAIFSSKFWGTFTAIFILVFHYMYEQKIFLGIPEELNKYDGFFKKEFYRSLVFSIFLLGVTAFITVFVVEIIK